MGICAFQIFFIFSIGWNVSIKVPNNSPKLQPKNNAVVPLFITSHSGNTYSKNNSKDSILYDAFDGNRPIEPLPYEHGYDPSVASRNFKYCGQPLDGDIRPTGNNVLIQKNKFHEYTQSGLYMGTKPNQEFIGRVLAVGPGKIESSTGKTIPMTVNVGDYVLFEPPVDDPIITLDDSQCVLIPEENIYAKAVNKDFSKPTQLASDIIAPIHDRLFVRIIDTPNKTASGLVIARSKEEKDHLIRAEIIAIGPGSYTKDGNRIPISDLKVGDVILFSDSTADGGEFTCDQKQHAFVRRCAVMAKL
ncbi:bifunctional Chaperonin GroES [Babesia duncani]|uniref:Bifunctional Chaperonin GroES n=1 Tax=Babesia duncani TaxID=323732 RepID=A0AAD9UPA2_9APIC|nr:bifunctional Chaperonin GroES [Babesia duncani]